jgi:predicted RNA-binding Zn ribbon-like protein
MWKWMAKKLHVHLHLPDVSALRTRIDALDAQGAHMAGELNRVKSEVEETKTVIGSAITLLESLSALIREHANSPAELTKIADDLDAQQSALAAAVAANTPAANDPAPEP